MVSVIRKGDYTNEGFEDLIIPEGIKELGEAAFSLWTQLQTVTLPIGLRVIGARCFEGCGFSQIQIPESVETICECAFAKCKNLNMIFFTHGAALREIKMYAFAQTGIVQFISPAGLRTIEAGAFADCKELERVALNNGLCTLGMQGEAPR